MATTINSALTTGVTLTSAAANPVYIDAGAGISVTTGDALFLGYNVPWNVSNRGVIAANTDGAVLGGGLLFNHGTISGQYGIVIPQYAAATAIVNYGDGAILGAQYAVSDRGNHASLSITNYGFIQGGSRNAAILGSGQDVSITNQGTLDGYVGVILVAGTNFISNSGTIQGGAVGVTAAHGGTVINSGSIGGLDSILFSGVYRSVLLVEPGAVFGGTVIGSRGVTSLEFASSSLAGTFSRLGSFYTGFSTPTIDAGARWTAAGANTLAAGYTLIDAGSLTLAGTLAGPGSVSLAAGVTLDVAPGGSLGAAVTGLAGATIALQGGVQTETGLAGGYLTLSGGTTLHLPGLAFASVTDSGSNTYITACFAAGTRIMGEFGPVPVEALGVGDLVRTAHGRLAPVRWLGHRRVNLGRHPRPHDVMPVRVRAGAFADLQPSRDLVLSPDHAVFVAGRLVPVRHLVNGASIVQERRDTVTYWHVELDRHDVILAEDLPCESYLDTGNRGAFANAEGPAELHPDFARRVWAAEGCAPILTDPADCRLRALHTGLLVRARRADASVQPAKLTKLTG